MLGSIKLLIATLGVSQFSNVIGTQENAKTREQLRRSLRKGIAQTASERKMQFMAFPSEEEAEEEKESSPGMDDLFDVPVAVVEVVNPVEDDDYFKSSRTGMDLDWGSAASDGDSHGHAHTADHTTADHMKSSKSSKLRADISTNDRVEKAAKVGKVMWDETPIMVKSGKSAKNMKDSKSLKSISIKGAKGGFIKPKRASSYYSEDSADLGHTHVIPDDDADFLAGVASSGNMGYGDLFNKGSHDVHRSDDYFEGASSPLNVEMDQVKMAQHAVQTRAAEPMSNSVTGRLSNTYDDDFFNEEERLVFRPRPVVTLSSSLFSVNPQTNIPPVVPDGSGNTLSVGTEYLFNEITTNAQNINSQLTPVKVDGEDVIYIIAIDGYCDRIGLADQNSVQGYCFFTYSFTDPYTSLLSGTVTAQGIMVNAAVPGQLAVTGGTGTMTGAIGLVEILPAAVNNNVNPPELVSPQADADPFNGVAGWAHFFEIDVDVLFFLPELYSR